MSGWSPRRRRTLIVLWFVLAALGVVEVVVLRTNGTLAVDRSNVLLLSVSPFFLLAIVHLALMYGSWFQLPGATATSGLKRGLFWILLLAFATLMIVFVWCFGLRAQ